MDTKSLKLVELINYNPKFDVTYLNKLIIKAKKTGKVLTLMNGLIV